MSGQDALYHWVNAAKGKRVFFSNDVTLFDRSLQHDNREGLQAWAPSDQRSGDEESVPEPRMKRRPSASTLSSCRAQRGDGWRAFICCSSQAYSGRSLK